MRLLDLTLDSPAENLALDEALLETAEQGGLATEVLRLWESPTPLVVLGRSSRAHDEVDLRTCEEARIPVLRRCSGGASVLTGPGCLMYAVVLAIDGRPQLRMVCEAHRLVLQIVADAIRPLVPGVRCQGTSDLTTSGRKFAGNSLRCKRGHVLYHGTILYDFPLSLVSRCLRSPPRQPDYRQGRGHEQFLTNLGVSAAELRRALVHGWQAEERCADWPEQLTRELVATRYSQASWNGCW